MMAAHIGLHIPVPSVSGQAVLTMPIMAPLADLLGMSRQIAVLAYQYGRMMDMITPTNGGLMAVLAAAGVGYDEWLRFAGPLMALLTALGGEYTMSNDRGHKAHHGLPSAVNSTISGPANRSQSS